MNIHSVSKDHFVWKVSNSKKQVQIVQVYWHEKENVINFYYTPKSYRQQTM